MTRFETYCQHRETEALTARLSGFYTIDDRSACRRLVAIGNAWSRRYFDGDFYRAAVPDASRPLVNLVFVESRDGHTVADDPSALGGGDTDKHLIYEGLSRVDADAVMAGAATAQSENMVFSIWHPALVALRRSRGHRRHPAQIVVTSSGRLPIERGLMFEEPSLPVYLITSSKVVPGLRARVRNRPWVDVVDAGERVSLRDAMCSLRQRGIENISAIGGRSTATALLLDGLVSDIYLTTSPIEAGEPHTPFYEGPPLNLTPVVHKAGRGAEGGVRFAHYLVG